MHQFSNSTPAVRRSVRLQENGYYGPDGKSLINYKERLFKVFKRHRHKQRDNGYGMPWPSWTSPNDSPKTKLQPLLCTLVVTAAIVGIVQIFSLSIQNVLPGSGPLKMLIHTEQSAGDASTAEAPENEAPMLNFALLSQQATILRFRSSSTYFRGGLKERVQWLLCSKHLYVLQTDSTLIPGHCWPFPGDKGHLHIQLSQNIQITHVTLGHITKAQLPTGKTTSAPKHFAVYGMSTLDGIKQLLGRFVYDTEGPAFQTFEVLGQAGISFKHVRLQVESNWGNSEYTCLYNFKVYGTPVPPADQVTPSQCS